MGIAAVIDHGFCTAEEAGEFFAFEQPDRAQRAFPVNTSGGNLAEGFIHGMSLVNEAVRQIRGESRNQVPGASALADDRRPWRRHRELGPVRVCGHAVSPS